MSTKPPILIAGAGIAGLTLAIALARRGHASRIFEARPEPPRDGAGIQLGPNATRILIELGLASALEPHAVTPDAIVVHNGVTGDELTRLPLGTWLAQRHGAPYWVLHRADLHEALWQTAMATPTIKIETGRAVSGVTEQGDETAFTFDSREQVSGQLLVGADGIWSCVRPQVDPSFEITYSGSAAARTLLSFDDIPEQFRNHVTGIWLAPNAHIVHYPVEAGRTLAIVAIAKAEKGPDDWSIDINASRVQERFADAPKPVRDLLALAKAWRQWPLYRRTRSTRMSGKRTVLIGDAAHPILPFLAQGGALAIEDGFELAKLFATATDETGALSQSAIDRFARSRRQRALKVEQASLDNGRAYHHAGAVAQVRNLALSTLPGHLFMRRYDWIYGYHAS